MLYYSRGCCCLQAIKLGLFPTMTVKHTGVGHAGQIYISEVNYLLMVACVLVVGGFRDTVAPGPCLRCAADAEDPAAAGHRHHLMLITRHCGFWGCNVRMLPCHACTHNYAGCSDRCHTGRHLTGGVSAFSVSGI
jgi:hypothetical protein